MNAIARPDWIAVDWGTTHMRAYAIGGDGAVLARAEGPGMGALADTERKSEAYEAALLDACSDWLSGSAVPVVMCGMVGSRQGWAEAGYLPLPASLDTLGDEVTQVPVRDGRLLAYIVPGLSQNDPYDVMRGEETQLAGWVHAHDHETASPPRICMPGTHSKWVHLDGRRVRHFSTAMTGELFDLIGHHSILAHSLVGDGFDAEAFGDAVRSAHERPACLTEALFSIRAEGLLIGADPARARARLSGLLIGAELAGARLESGERVVLIGAPRLCARYAQALSILGHDAVIADGEAMVLAGLTAIHAQLTAQRETVS